MKAMILAAGLGTRMRPLTDTIPKPLLPVGNVTLIDMQLKKLADAGIKDVVINISYLAEKIEHHLATNNNFGLNIVLSKEVEPLETAGGIKQALHLLGDEAFLVVNGDVWTDYPLEQLVIKAKAMHAYLAHLVLVKNPEHHSAGDFSIDLAGRVLSQKSAQTFTFSGLSILSPQIFEQDLVSNRLADVLIPLIDSQQVSAELYTGQWLDVGTPARLECLRQLLG